MSVSGEWVRNVEMFFFSENFSNLLNRWHLWETAFSVVIATMVLSVNSIFSCTAPGMSAQNNRLDIYIIAVSTSSE